LKTNDNSSTKISTAAKNDSEIQKKVLKSEGTIGKKKFA